jgi:hypothetical protein
VQQQININDGVLEWAFSFSSCPIKTRTRIIGQVENILRLPVSDENVEHCNVSPFVNQLV